MNQRMDESGGAVGGRGAHVGEFNLRRLLAGESLGETHAASAAHAAGCAECSKRLDALAGEQRAFEARISFDRFAAGVQRAARVPAPPAPKVRWWNRPASTRSFMTVFSMGAVATCVVLVMGVRPLFENARLRQAADRELTAANRTKGAARAGVTFRIAAADEGPQRTAASDAPEALSTGERIRVGVQPGTHRFLFAFSIDDHGVITPLYPEVGTSMPLPNGGRMQYLPDSLELTGQGTERVVVLLTDVPLELDTVRRAAVAALRQAGGNLARVPPLALPGEQFHRLFLKP